MIDKPEQLLPYVRSNPKSRMICSDREYIFGQRRQIGAPRISSGLANSLIAANVAREDGKDTWKIDPGDLEDYIEAAGE